VVKSFNATAYTATVQAAGSLSVFLANVPVSRGIPSGEMTAGRACALLLFDEANPTDAVVAAVYTA
jgi:hypothetical protein